jgi:phosphate-selective porin OprO/OprP
MKTADQTLRTALGSILMLAAAHAGAVDSSFSAAEGLELRTADDIRLRVTGRLQTDGVRFDDDVTPLDDEEDFRRARIGARLDWADWRVVAAYDFGVADGWKNLYVQYAGWKKQRLTLGNQVAAFSMEDLSSSKNLPLLERSVATALAPGVLQGLSYRTWRDRWSLRAGVYGNELSDMDRRKLDGTSVMSRFTFAPILSEQTALHIGLSGEYRWLDDQAVRLRARPGTRLTNTRLVDTRNFEDADTATTGGFEVAIAHRNLRLQSEAMLSGIERDSGDLDFNAQYVTLSMLLGGESYSYSASRGTFAAVKPGDGWGTLELAARVGRLDLSDGDIEGGEQIEYTFGLGWTITEQIKVMVNYTDIDADPNRDGIDEDVSLWSARLQYSM